MEKEERVMENKFLGTEKVGKLLKMFAIPCVLSLIIQALYNIVDQLFIGNCASLGQLGNTATGIVYPLTVIALAIGLLLGDGAASKMSINQGQNNTKDTNNVIGTSLSIGTIISLILLAFCFIFRTPILKGLGASDVVFNFASEYSTFIIIGFPFFILTTILNPIIRADGSPRFAMISVVIGAVVNIGLDPLFIFGFDMGMTGAALATFIAQVISFALSVGYLFKSKSFKLRLQNFIPKFKLFGAISKLGISSFLTQIAIVIISIVNNNMLLKLLPNDNSAIGLLTIAFKVFGIVISVAIGISCGGQPILGYNYGAKKYDRVKETFKLIIITTLIVGFIATILFIFAPKYIMMLFGYSEVSAFGINTFRIYLSFILLTCFTKAVSIFFQAIGMPIKSTLVAMCRDLIFLVPLTIIMATFGVKEFLWSAPISDILTTIMAVTFLIVTFKKLNNVTEEEIKETKIKKSKQGVIITISREHGAGGREIGKEVAKLLNIPFYDKELTSIIAYDTGLAKEYIDNLEEKNSALYNIYLTKNANVEAINAQSKVLRQIAEKGSCVIVGRCADFVLRDYNICRVFINAPIEYRVERIMKNYSDSNEDARKNIEKSDKNRAEFYNNVTGKIWGDRENYDIIINSEIGVENSAKLIYDYVKDGFNN